MQRHGRCTITIRTYRTVELLGENASHIINLTIKASDPICWKDGNTKTMSRPLKPTRSAVHRKLHSCTCLPFLQFFGGGIYAPDPSTYDPIEILLNAETEDERNELTAKWRDNKLSELNFVGVVVSTERSFLPEPTKTISGTALSLFTHPVSLTLNATKICHAQTQHHLSPFPFLSDTSRLPS